uniref:Uncharacterized protein n=1 Tax=Rhizophora mucronata TaxID=61149 RepID=A0A2P2QBT0_RHIMU
MQWFVTKKFQFQMLSRLHPTSEISLSQKAMKVFKLRNRREVHTAFLFILLSFSFVGTYYCSEVFR